MKPSHSPLVLALVVLCGCASQQPAVSAAAPAATPFTPIAAGAPGNVQPLPDDAQRLVPLQGAWNVRSFAGLQGRNGPIPADAFLRTADLGRLTAADRDALAAAGVRVDIDLRTADEQAQSPDLLAGDARFDYQRISLMGTEKMDLEQLVTRFPDSLGQAYVQWLGGNQPQFRQVFARMAAQEQGTVLFHCTAGKDRTGVIAALLLDLAGVPHDAIVHDYAISAHYLQGQPRDSAMNAQLKAMLTAHPELGRKLAGMAGTAPQDMQMFLAALSRQYGGAEGYLRTIGLSQAQIERLRARLGQVG
ncbi:tyrosine-protein phosphatase [Pseudoxanthomonas composti]|uniref:Tyrosine-protein phosphatase n=1 Tax=Pseudoxanthomonas composti TaxID=2137479 RepID=A0A4Q1JZA7_9GAMM|nr:tyrosine-protein phosphatase [Pseudoxanthomonas composti]RXR08670.1 tyrosine-protein phosphatase [Pseudoxanthomonas composti]